MAGVLRMTDIEWVEPPPAPNAKGVGRHALVVTELRARPGEWALVSRGVSPGTVSNMRKRAYQPSTDFEITTRKAGDNYGKRDVYVRYVGGAS